MAQRRMLNIDLIIDDRFTLGLSPEAQNMYVYLNMLADDDGIVGHLKRQLRMLNKQPKYVSELIRTGYILKFDDETIVITDWLINNRIKGDRYTPSREDECRNALFITYKWQYTLNGNQEAVLISLNKWTAGKREINGQRFDRFNLLQLKEFAKKRFSTLNKKHGTTMEQTCSKDGPDMEQQRNNLVPPSVRCRYSTSTRFSVRCR